MEIVVLKLSGKTLTDFLSSKKWTKIIQELRSKFDGVVIVHGAGKLINEWSGKLGIENKFKKGQRITTQKQMNIVAAVQAGLVNSQIITKLNYAGLNATGVSGIDRNTFVADYIDPELGFVGKPKLKNSINWIFELLEDDVIPVFSSVCRDANGNLMNVNADIFTEVLSIALKVDTVFFVSDVSGVMINGAVKNILTEHEIIYGIANGDIKDGMIPKLLSCALLLNKGINKVWIGSQLHTNFEKDKNTNGTWIINSIKKEVELLFVAQYV